MPRPPMFPPAYYQDSWWWPRMPPPPPPPPPPSTRPSKTKRTVPKAPTLPPKEVRAKMPRQVAGDVAGSTYLMPANRVNLCVVGKGFTFDAIQRHAFHFKLHAVACSTTIDELIEMLGGRAGWKVTEIFEGGAGVWYKGVGVAFGEAKASQAIESLGWAKTRGTKDGKPVWIMLERV